MIKIIDLPGLPPKGDIVDWLVAGGTPEALLSLVTAAPDIQGGPRDSRPQIVINGRQLIEVIGDSWEAVKTANQPEPFLFSRAGVLVRLLKGEPGYRIDVVDDQTMYGHLTRSADWYKQTQDGLIPANPSRNVAADMLAFVPTGLPPLGSVITAPVFGREGKLICVPGYHLVDALYLDLPEELCRLKVPSHPTLEDVARAVQLILEEYLGDFPFDRESDRAHAVAALLQPFVRPMIVGCTPIYTVESRSPGSGKGLYANTLSIIVTGTAAEAMTLPGSDEETRKKLTAELSRGRASILIDNVGRGDGGRRLDSQSLASILTAEQWSDRILGETRMISMPNRALWLLTGNNLRLSMELARRSIRILIDPKTDRPWLRKEFRHDPLQEWVRQHRADLVWASLVLIQAWIAAGKPQGKVKLGSFEAWSGVMGGILGVAGISGFLQDLDKVYETADAEGEIWREFVQAWWEGFRDEPQRVADLNTLCDEMGLMTSIRRDGVLPSQVTRLGQALQGARDRIFGNFRITLVTDGGRHKGRLYALAPISSPEEGFPRAAGDVDETGPPQCPPEITSVVEGGSEKSGDVGDVDATPTHECEDPSNRWSDDSFESPGDSNVPHVPQQAAEPYGTTPWDGGPSSSERPPSLDQRSPQPPHADPHGWEE